jgi:hypothetical protein
LVITTNFDDLMERAITDAHARHSTRQARLHTVASLESSGRTLTMVGNDDRPLAVKLHSHARYGHHLNPDALGRLTPVAYAVWQA